MQKNTQELLQKVYEAKEPDVKDLVALLSIQEPTEIQKLYDFADKVRKEFVGDGIFLRGIIEFSNYCQNQCYYCGINKNNKSVERYKLSKEEILEVSKQIIKSNVKTIVLQSGEEDDLKAEWLADVIKAIKNVETPKLGVSTGIAITLSVGERKIEDYKLWKDAGADRYLLKIETSDKALYEKFHPEMSFDNRVNCLKNLKKLGYETGSGIIIGLKGQTLETIANDILFFKKFKFEMIGIGPFIPHAQTKLASEKQGDVPLTLKTIALTRIVAKTPNMPGTTALGSLDKDYRYDALKAGANVLMPNFTPVIYKQKYDIYPKRRCVGDAGSSCVGCMNKSIKAIGRHIKA